MKETSSSSATDTGPTVQDTFPSIPRNTWAKDMPSPSMQPLISKSVVHGANSHGRKTNLMGRSRQRVSAVLAALSHLNANALNPGGSVFGGVESHHVLRRS